MVPSQGEVYKKLPSPKDYEEVYKEVPSQRDYEEVYKEVSSQRDYEEVYKEVSSQRDYEEVPSQRDDKEVPSLPSIPKYDIMPLVKFIRSREELQNTEWVSVIYNFLQTVNKSVSPHVNVVFGDSNHSHLVENWITAAVIRLKPPLHNVMVLSLDYSLCNQLLSKNFSLTCIPVPEKALVVAHPNGSNAEWNSAMMIRRVVLRLISYWGYDVASYDSDAVLLRNPQVLYDAQPNVDVFSASSNFLPQSVSRKWGFTLSGGVLVLRASPAVGVYNYILPCAKIYTITDIKLSLYRSTVE